MATKNNTIKTNPAPQKPIPAKKKAKTKKPTPKAPKRDKPEIKPKEEKPIGRPSIYTQEIADRICAEIASSSKSLRTICEQEGMPSVVTMMAWLRTNDEFLKQYTRAKEEQADYLIEEMIDISDDGSNDFMTIKMGKTEIEVENKEVTSRSKLRVETRKWIASKLKPKKYGEKLDVTSTNTTVVVGYEPVEED